MKKKILVLLVVIICVLGVWYFFSRRDARSSDPIEVTKTEPTNFVKTGTLSFDPVPVGQSPGYFIYQDEKNETVMHELTFDGFSVCASSGGAIPCIAMSVTFDIPFNNKQALVEGNFADRTILVRKMRVLEPDEEPSVTDFGDTFISWPQAVELIENCKVNRITQTRALDVYLTLTDDQEVRAVEPVIDEVLKVIDRSRAACGKFPVSTE